MLYFPFQKLGSNLIGQDFWNKFSKYIPPKDGKKLKSLNNQKIIL